MEKIIKLTKIRITEQVGVAMKLATDPDSIIIYACRATNFGYTVVKVN